MNTKSLKEQIEFLAEEVHNSWWEEKKKQGFHAPLDCPSGNYKHFRTCGDIEGKRRFYDNGSNPKTFKWCKQCHPDMYPYGELADNIKEYDRVTVRTVIDAVEKLENK